MEYQKTVPGIFLSRPNRFIAYVETAAGTQRVHVKNTGRCRELLTDGAQVWLAESGNPNRKTAYDLVTVRKGERLVNIDSYAPNLAAGEWLLEGGLFREVGREAVSCSRKETTAISPEVLRPETVYGNSRLDFYARAGGREYLIEVKGVTLERDGTALFPDAPSERAVKHVRELIKAAREGYAACLLFVIQMKGIQSFRPNEETQPAFAEALLEAREAGVLLLARDCLVTENSMRIANPVPVEID